MNLSTEQLAELLAGIARSQQAIIDAIESESGGWRNTHLLPKLNTASNMRLATPRLLDIPSRILLRSQGRVAMDVAQLEIAKARAAEKYTLDAVGSLSGSRASGGVVSGIPGTTRSASIGLQFNLPLYTGGQTQNRIQETLLLEEKARQDLEAARRGIAQSTRVAFFGVQSGQAQVKALEAAESSAKLALEATQLGYRVGVRVNLDVLNAQTQLFQTQRDLAKARYDVILNRLKLRQASGVLTPQDVYTVEALLLK